MIIATFGPTTAWVGKTITYDGNVFTVEEQGQVSAADVMRYDAEGQITWSSAQVRDLVAASMPVGHQVGPPNAPPTTAAPLAQPLARHPDAQAIPTSATPSPPWSTVDTASKESAKTSECDLVATFNATTGWRGKTITLKDDHFILEGHGHVSPRNVMKYDEQGQLAWASDEIRSRVDRRARRNRGVILVATFNSSTGWAGTTITHEDKHFVLKGHGRVMPKNIMKYDEKDQLDWASGEMRPWVVSLAQTRTRTRSEPETRPRREVSGPLPIVGLLLVIGGLLVTFYFLVAFDVSVYVPYEYSAYDFSSGYERINNIGLMNDQRNGIIGGIVAAVVGGILLFVAYSRGELDDWLKRAPASDERKCPYCAESIKVEALVCRHCNRDVSPGGRSGANA